MQHNITWMFNIRNTSRIYKDMCNNTLTSNIFHLWNIIIVKWAILTPAKGNTIMHIVIQRTIIVISHPSIHSSIHRKRLLIEKLGRCLCFALRIYPTIITKLHEITWLMLELLRENMQNSNAYFMRLDL